IPTGGRPLSARSRLTTAIICSRSYTTHPSSGPSGVSTRFSRSRRWLAASASTLRRTSQSAIRSRCWAVVSATAGLRFRFGDLFDFAGERPTQPFLHELAGQVLVAQVVLGVVDVVAWRRAPGT